MVADRLKTIRLVRSADFSPLPDYGLKSALRTVFVVVSDQSSGRRKKEEGRRKNPKGTGKQEAGRMNFYECFQ